MWVYSGFLIQLVIQAPSSFLSNLVLNVQEMLRKNKNGIMKKLN